MPPPVLERRLAPCTGLALELAGGDRLVVIDPEGGQPTWSPSPAMTRGHVLYSSHCRPMLAIEEDDVGRHDLLFTPCSPEMFHAQYGLDEHPNCLDNLAAALAPHGLAREDVPTPFNVFMNTRILPDGTIALEPPLSHAGDRIVFRAEMDLVVAVSACSAPRCNGGELGPIDVQVLAAEPP